MRSHNLHFIPRSYNFSEMDPRQIEELSQDIEEQTFMKEQLILDSIRSMSNDRQRVVFFFEILRGFGYQLDCESIARAMGIERRWYQRIKQNMRNVLKLVV
jgi:aryl carrier-like protein